MKRKVFNCSLVMSFLAICTFGVSACSQSAAYASGVSVKLDKTFLEMGVGDTQKLMLSVTKGYSGTVRWFTSNESVAVVRSGLVTAVGEGTAMITAAFAGGFADCEVVVSGMGGSGTEPGARLRISPESKAIGLNDTYKLGVSVYPVNTKINYETSDPRVATVSEEGVVTGVGLGQCVITASGDNDKVATCSITVRESVSTDDLDIAVSNNLNYSGTLTVGAPKIQRDWMISMLREFNNKTNSNITFNVPEFEEDNGTSGYNNAAAMPAVFPYASDQTLTLSQFKVLSKVSTTDKNWIRDNMGTDAMKAASLSSNVVGYPFAADNGVVMFYDSSVVTDPSQIDTLDELFELADQKDMEVNFAYGTGFYAAGALMTYSGGASLYSLTAKNTDYTSEAHFSETTGTYANMGLQAAKLIKEISKKGSVRNATTAPDGTKDVMVTITDVSKVASFKAQLGSRYAVAPLPYVDEAKTVRLGSYLGYKFFGVNNTLSKEDKEKASDVAKFLCSEYVQSRRFDDFNTRPTLSSLENYAKDEPHIAALKEQSDAHATIPLTAVSSELWSQTATAVTSIKGLSGGAADSDYLKILEVLDKALTRG